jgi:hypothetical protein
MLGWALPYLVVAIVTAVFGFDGVAAGAASIAKIKISSCARGTLRVSEPAAITPP